MWSNTGMANRQGDVDLRFAQVSASQLALWLGLESQHSALTTEGVNTVRLHIKKGVISLRHIKKGVTTFNRQPRCLARTGHSTAQPLAALGPQLDQSRAVSIQFSLCRTPKPNTSTGTSPLMTGQSLLNGICHPLSN